MPSSSDFEQNKKEAVPQSLPVSTHGPTVVGIGASAGGLAALKTFFSLISEDSGLAFVVVMHLSPEHESHLADLLQRYVKMPVVTVGETIGLTKNTVYVIPPNANLNTIDTHLRLSPLEEQRSARAPIDHFFRTLSKTHDGRAIGVILSGTGSDGTLGLREIKAQGGLAIVQDPNDAEFDGMPQSAISNGAADIILPLAEIPKAIMEFVQTQPRITGAVHAEQESDDRQILHRIFALLRTRTNRDFSRYKSATILRRIARRMQFHKLEILSDYLDKLRDQPEETRALADDLLINVTSFFRDPEVFQLLETRIIPQLFTAKQTKENIRVWSVGCATGEEAYSLAMILIENASRLNHPPLIQVFASELHPQSLDKAREGFYPGDIETDVSPERLQRFFHHENGGYRIRKEVRELVIFAPHNIMSDPPFSRVDLISCRNLLIYLQREVQREVIEVFHYALNPDGYLLLGTSETADAPELFRIEDKKRCFYRKLNMPRPELRLPVFPLIRAKLTSDAISSEALAEPVSYGSLHQRMVEQVAPPSILVSADDKVVHLSANVGRFLIHPGGEMTTSLYKLVREEMRIELRTALHQCRELGEPVHTQPIPVRFNDDTNMVSLQVRISADPQQVGFALIIFEEWGQAGSGNHKPARDLPIPSPSEEESEVTRLRMQAIIDAYETGQEELKSTIEEIQSTNEELRSTMEELETSKEELQSLNEELQTVNQENRHKVDELAQLSGDVHNLLAATDIATLFLDRQFCILRFTPKVSELFNVRMTDRGRPLSNFTHRLGYNKLSEDAKQVLAQLTNIEREVQDENGQWYLSRLRPYRSTDDRIEGVVITFFDITVRKHAEVVLRESEERQTFLLKLSDALRSLSDPLAIVVESSRVLGQHLGVCRAFYAEVEPDEDHVLVQREYLAPNTTSIAGRIKLSDFGTYWVENYRAGKTLAVSNVADICDSQPAAFEVVGVRACIGVPVNKNGKLAGLLIVHSETPREWTSFEVAMIEETAERTWAAVVRANAESARNEVQKELHLLNAALDERVRVQTEELLLRETQLHALALELTNAEQKERRRIAHLLHDEVQQLVVAAKMRAGSMQASPISAEHKEELQLISEMMEQILTVTRLLIADLVPLNLHEHGLGAALSELASKMRQQHNLLVRVNYAKNAEPYEDHLRELLFDGARELLLNVVKHAETDCAWVDLERKEDQIAMTVRDLGKGSSRSNSPRGGFGLFHLRERLKSINGQLEIVSTPGEGTNVTIRVKSTML